MTLLLRTSGDVFIPLAFLESFLVIFLKEIQVS